MRDKSFKPRYYNNVYIGSALIIVAIVMLLAKDSASDRVILGGLFAISGTLTIIQALSIRLVFTENAIGITGLIPKKIRYSDIAKVEWGKVAHKGGSGYGRVACLIVSSQQGKRLRVLPVRFSGYEGSEGWATLLLKIISDHGILADSETIQRLNSAALKSTPARPNYV